MRRVSPEEAEGLVAREGYVYLDVRTAPEFEAGHPVGAYNVPWTLPGDDGPLPNPSFFEEVATILAPEQAVVVGCATGVRSLQAAEALEQRGYRHVVELRAGFDGVRDPFGRVRERGWRAAALPVSIDAEPGHSHREIVRATQGEREV